MAFIKSKPALCLLRPALECGHGEEREHAVEHVVKVEVAVEPLSLGQHGVLEGVLHVLPEESPAGRRKRTVTLK